MFGLISTVLRLVPFVFESHSRPRYPGPGPISSATPSLIPNARSWSVPIQPLSLKCRCIWSNRATSASPWIPSIVSIIRVFIRIPLAAVFGLDMSKPFPINGNFLTRTVVFGFFHSCRPKARLFVPDATSRSRMRKNNRKTGYGLDVSEPMGRPAPSHPSPRPGGRGI